MTVNGWIGFGFLSAVIIAIGAIPIVLSDKIIWKILSGTLIVICIILLLFGMLWYYKNTASGQRELTDHSSEKNWEMSGRSLPKKQSPAQIF